ncbi:hypothetical protein RUM43_012489 [Polyplax serrata]|uniref:Uncharacterized protein n=1 Tax=Polyplax serrata TaxID=468196 RepID=A0AAN8NKS8_POLSC
MKKKQWAEQGQHEEQERFPIILSPFALPPYSPNRNVVVVVVISSVVVVPPTTANSVKSGIATWQIKGIQFFKVSYFVSICGGGSQAKPRRERKVKLAAVEKEKAQKHQALTWNRRDGYVIVYELQ